MTIKALRLLSQVSCIFLCVATVHPVCAQAALLLEQPFGLFGRLNPTGHTAIYLEHVCADTPVHLRLCKPGENGVVISRYHDMGGYDWVAIPLIPYLYAVDDPAQVPAKVDKETVDRFRDHYKEAVLGAFGDSLPKGNAFHDGWVQLVGTAYDRRTYAFRFATTRAQDEALIAMVNAHSNKSHFNLEYQNCADFDRFILNSYFPDRFHRKFFPDAGMTTPKHVAYALERYARKHPDETQLTVVEIPQVPGYRHDSVNDRGVDESLIMDGYVIPIAIVNPYIAGGMLVDFLINGRYKLVPKNPPEVAPEKLDALTKQGKPNAPGATPKADSPEKSAPAASETPAAAPDVTPKDPQDW
jgi:hypothetical protein